MFLFLAHPWPSEGLSRLIRCPWAPQALFYASLALSRLDGPTVPRPDPRGLRHRPLSLLTVRCLQHHLQVVPSPGVPAKVLAVSHWRSHVMPWLTWSSDTKTHNRYAKDPLTAAGGLLPLKWVCPQLHLPPPHEYIVGGWTPWEAMGGVFSDRFIKQLSSEESEVPSSFIHHHSFAQNLWGSYYVLSTPRRRGHR